MLAKYTSRSGFADGVGMPRDRISGFDALLDAAAAPERLDGARCILAAPTAASRASASSSCSIRTRSQQAAVAACRRTGRASCSCRWASASCWRFSLARRRDVRFRGRHRHREPRPAATAFPTRGPRDDAERRPRSRRTTRTASRSGGSQPLQRLRAATRARVVHDSRWAEALNDVLVPGGLANSC